ncbi:MAG: glycosyltransferase, partial [Anaerolineales bacterium]|nr:glycosyltransferase [Anaerolineales bacterium]
MKILFIVPYVPNLVRVRPYNMIRSLAERGHQVTVLTLWTNEAEQSDIEHLREFCDVVHTIHMPGWRSLWNCAQVLPTRDPLQSVYSWQPALVEPFLNDASYDVVHVEHLRGARYGLHFKQHSNIPVVWDSVDCITHLFRQASAQSTDRLRRWRSRLDLKRTERYEGWLVNQFDRVLVTSPTDKQILTSLSENGSTPPIEVIPNGVALQYFYPDTAVSREA